MGGFRRRRRSLGISDVARVAGGEESDVSRFQRRGDLRMRLKCEAHAQWRGVTEGPVEAVNAFALDLLRD